MKNKGEQIQRETQRLQRAINFWGRVAAVTRFGVHGFVLWRYRRAFERAVEHNKKVESFNNMEAKHRRRLKAMRGMR